MYVPDAFERFLNVSRFSLRDLALPGEYGVSSCLEAFILMDLQTLRVGVGVCPGRLCVVLHL